MSKQKMSIHRALAELKVLDSRIHKVIENIEPYGMIKGKSTEVHGTNKTSTAFINNAKSDLQSVLDLIKRKTAIKSAIVHSNSITQVVIADKVMSVADAITRKDLIGLENLMLTHIKNAQVRIKQEIESKNTYVEDNLQRVLENAFGKDGVKTDPSAVKDISDSFRETNSWKLVEGVSDNQLEKLSNEIEDFMVNVDAVLSESNATTFIEV